MRLSSYFFLLLCISITLQMSVEGRGTVKLKFRVIDQDGIPVENARISPDENDPATDVNGYTSYRAQKSISDWIGAGKEGYYGSRGPQLFTLVNYDESQVHTIILKKILNPIPMYVKRYIGRDMVIPVNDEEIGYDMEKGDWVAPYGEGLINDFIFKFEGDRLENINPYMFSRKITVTFSNEYDGLIPYIVEENSGSDLKSNHLAPEDGYLNKWEQTTFREGKETSQHTTRNKNRNYYFRVRTTVDGDGNIVNANYGKIYGDFMDIAHYFNPTPNDRNVEFDPKRNLFTVPYPYTNRKFFDVKWP